MYYRAAYALLDHMNGHWHLQPAFSYPVLALVVLGLLVVLVLRPTFGKLTAWQRMALVGTRMLVVLLILLALLRPTRVHTSRESLTATLIILFDKSRSMQLPSSTQGKDRWQDQIDALVNATPNLKAISEKLELKIYAYDSELHSIEFDGQALKLPESADGEQTDIGSAIHEAVTREAGNRLAGVVLLGDGTQTAYDPEIDVREAVRELARMDYPLYCVGFGPPSGTTQSRDIAMENLQDKFTVFVKNEVAVRAMVRISGYVNQNVPVELVAINSKGVEKTVGTANARAREDGEQVAVQISYVPQAAGQYKLTMRAATRPDELVVQNNHLTAFLTVLEGGLNVLYLYGDRLGEQSKLRESVNASPDIDMNHVFVDRKTRSQWPLDFGDTFTKPQYDVLLLEDIDADALGPENLAAIAKAVDAGKGLMMLGGFHSFGPGGYSKSPLADVLPVRMDSTRQESGIGSRVVRELHLWGNVRMLPSQRPHPITRLGPAAQNDSLWRQLPELTGANRFAGVKQRAQILAETEQQQPLLVAGEYGDGRTLAFAGNSTVRWWRYGFDSQHRRFWRQVVLWLVGRNQLNENDVWVELEQRRYNPGSRVVFTAGAKTPDGDTINDANFEVKVTGPDGKEYQTVISKDLDKIVGAVDNVRQPGQYIVSVTASIDRPIGSTTAEFIVFDRDIELSNPDADFLQLERLAAQTKHVGGRMLAAEELPALLDEIYRLPPKMEFEQEQKWQLGDTAIDAWLFFLALLGILTAEWVLRKRWGLV
ncbi:MAG: putative membrane protein [Pirellulaceae bacterium]|jgi:uncharacterized membrane protein